MSTSEQQWIKNHPQIRVRVSPSYPPFEFFEQDHYQGMAYDYLTLIGSKLGIEFVPVPGLTWEQSLDSARRRDGVDLILLLTPTPERAQYLDFTRDYINFPSVIFSRKDAAFIGQLGDLSAKTIAIERGFITADWLQRDVPDIRIVFFNSSTEAIKAVALNKVDAYVGDLAVGTYLIEKNGLVNLKVASPAPYNANAMAMGVRNDWPELTAMINRVLLSLTHDEHQSIRQKWLSLRIEHGLQLSDVIQWVLIVGGICLLWVAQLRWTVNRRTRELRREVDLRQEKERQLERQFAQMTAIFDSLEAVVYVADMKTMELLYLNKYGSRLFGENWQGKTCYKVFHLGQAAGCTFCNSEKLVVDNAPGPPQNYEQFNEITSHWYQCIGRAIYWTDGRLVRIEIAIDITDRKEVDRIKDEMISVVSHEVRTPLTGMMGYAELMMEMDMPPEQRNEFLAIIYHETERLSGLFDNFLNLQTLKIGKSSPSFSPVDLEEVLKDAVGVLRGVTRKHQLQFDCQAGLPTVSGEAEQLHRVFLNLLSNAVKYSPEGGPILISAQRSDNEVVVRVTDQGLGISPAAQARIFEPFYRVDNGDNRRIGGTGLGLALVKETVTQHGGRVWMESQLGKGSAFFVSLPVVEN